MTGSAAARAARDALVYAVHARTAAGLLPPVVRTGPDGLVRVERQLGGPADAVVIAELLDRPEFSTLLEMFATLAGGCVSLQAEFPGHARPGILRPANGALFGPIVGPAFLSCLSGAGPRFRPVEQAAHFLAFLREFLHRLSVDAERLWFDARLPITGLTAHDGETHNGRRRVLRVDFPDGRSVAYKPRPADVDRLFLAPENSAFALLNDLSDTVRLPVMDSLPRDGYQWQEWIDRPPQWGVIHQTPHASLSGAVLADGEVNRFWHRAGSLTAACFGFGITDLSEGNLYVGGADPMMYPIDLELAFVDVRRLSETGLVEGEGAQHHHVGLETVPRLCAADGPTRCLVDQAGLRTWRRTSPWARDETRTVVADTARRTGYGAHLTSFLRGMFDSWTLMCTNVSELRAVLDQPATTRVLLRPTSEYGDLLDDWLLDGTPLPHDLLPDERDQLLRHDVPYFYRSTSDGPLHHWDPETSTSVPTAQAVPPRLDWAAGLTLSRLGVALRDAVAPVVLELTDRSRTLVLDDTTRVAVRDADQAAVSFDWAEANRWVCYRWSGPKVSLRLAPLDQVTALRERLLKLDRVDAAWRSRWAESGFTDDTIAQRLTKLTTTAATWLQEVIDEHGWPGPLLVGEQAAEAACRLVQHLEDQHEFQRACLDLLTAAVDVPGRHVAYLADALCVSEGRPQVYGTKFEATDGQLVPCALQEPDTVDVRRAAVGLEPLAAYAVRLRQRFPLATSEVS